MRARLLKRAYPRACSNIEIPQELDGELLKALGSTNDRNYDFTQIIHPNQPYRAIITEKDYTFILETKENVENYNNFFTNIQIKYINKDTKEDVRIQYPEKVEIFEVYNYSMIKEFKR